MAAEDYHTSLQKTQQKFHQDASLYDAVVSELGEMRNDFDRQLDIMEILVSLWSRMRWLTKELSFLRFVILAGRWDANALRQANQNGLSTSKMVLTRPWNCAARSGQDERAFKLTIDLLRWHRLKLNGLVAPPDKLGWMLTKVSRHSWLFSAAEQVV